MVLPSAVLLPSISWSGQINIYLSTNDTKSQVETQDCLVRSTYCGSEARGTNKFTYLSDHSEPGMVYQWHNQ
jgi:hypothetical protein